MCQIIINLPLVFGTQLRAFVTPSLHVVQELAIQNNQRGNLDGQNCSNCGHWIYVHVLTSPRVHQLHAASLNLLCARLVSNPSKHPLILELNHC
jgi:hypothetical protein